MAKKKSKKVENSCLDCFNTDICMIYDTMLTFVDTCVEAQGIHKKTEEKKRNLSCKIAALNCPKYQKDEVNEDG